MESTLVDIDANESSVVFKALFATTGRLSVPNDTRAVRPAVDAIARVLAQEVHTLSIVRTVGVVKTIDFLTAILSVVWVARKEAQFWTFAMNLMVAHCAEGVRSTRVDITRIDAFGHSVKVTSASCVFRTVRVATRTFTGVLTSSKAVADLTIRAHTTIASGDVLTDTSFVTGSGQTLVYVHTSETSLVFESGNA